jgi:uncharacterized protein (TIGR02271 family)
LFFIVLHQCRVTVWPAVLETPGGCVVTSLRGAHEGRPRTSRARKERGMARSVNVSRYDYGDYYRGRKVVAAVFDDRADAERAITALRDAGFPPDRIGVALRDRTAQGELVEETGTKAAEGAATGALGGGLLGGLVGLLVGLGALAIPGVGPVVAGGALASAFGLAGGTAVAGAGIGAAAGGLVGALVGMGIPEEEAKYFESGFRSGRTLVTVEAGADRAGEAADLLRAYGGDIGPASARSTGAAAARGVPAAPEPVAEREGQVRVPVREERLEVEKRPVELGAVEVRKTVETEQQTVPVELEREEVHVEQRDVPNRPASEADLSGAFQEGTIRVPVRGEEAVARKEAVVTGEVVIDKERATETQRVTDTLRKERVEVDEDYERRRTDYQRAYAGRQRPGDLAYEEAEPHYRFGYGAGLEAREAGRSWEQAEADLRARYRTAGADDDAWERLKREVREGFDRARGR